MVFGGKPQSKTELNFWVMPNAGFATRSVLQGMINEFEANHPDITIKLTIHPWSLSWNRLMDVIKGRYPGPKPDLLQVGTTHVATLAYLGALDKIPDTNVLPEDDQMSAYIWDPGAQSESGGDLFCVPWFIDVRVLYYRRDIFDELHLSPDLLHDWKGFYHACSAIHHHLKKSGVLPKIVAPVGIPGQKAGVLMHDLAPWIWEAGGDFCSESMAEAALDSTATVKGCEFYFDLINQGFMPIPDSPIPPGNFFTGHYAMQFSGSWPVSSYLNPLSPLADPDVANNFGVALFPSGPSGRFTFLGGSNLAVSSQSEKKTLAWEFIRFLSHPARQQSHANAIGALTARLASLEELFAKHTDAKKVFWDSFGHARRLPRLIELGSIEQIVYKLGHRVLSQIRSGEYNHRLLHHEIASANNGIKAVLSLHRYGINATQEAA